MCSKRHSTLNGGLRLCEDHKVTTNPVLDMEQYPLPKPDDIFATLALGKLFTTLDLTHAYNQLQFDDESKHCESVRI